MIEQIIDDPTQAPTLLADNLPTASTFYLSFFVLQGITVTASTIFQAGPFLILTILSPFVDSTPRKKFERWTTLPSLSWGGMCILTSCSPTMRLSIRRYVSEVYNLCCNRFVLLSGSCIPLCANRSQLYRTPVSLHWSSASPPLVSTFCTSRSVITSFMS